jgi:hypothetical protein
MRFGPVWFPELRYVALEGKTDGFVIRVDVQDDPSFFDKVVGLSWGLHWRLPEKNVRDELHPWLDEHCPGWIKCFEHKWFIEIYFPTEEQMRLFEAHVDSLPPRERIVTGQRIT